MRSRSGGRPSANLSRSSIGRAGSCQGKVSAGAAGALAAGAALTGSTAGPAGLRPSAPAKKSLSQARWAGVNGALSGRTGIVMGESSGARGEFRLRGGAVKHFQQLFGRVPADEVVERLVALAVGEVGPQHPLDDGRRLIGRNGAEDLAAQMLVRPVAAADEDVVALDRVLAGLDLRAEQAHVAEVVLGTGVRTTSQVDVDRLIQLDPAL